MRTTRYSTEGLQSECVVRVCLIEQCKQLSVKVLILHYVHKWRLHILWLMPSPHINAPSSLHNIGNLASKFCSSPSFYMILIYTSDSNPLPYSCSRRAIFRFSESLSLWRGKIPFRHLVDSTLLFGRLKQLMMTSPDTIKLNTLTPGTY